MLGFKRFSCTILFLAFCYSCLYEISVARADYRDNPPPIPGWTHEESLSSDSPQSHGIALQGNDVTYTSPVIAEIDGDTSDGKEVAIASSDGTVAVYKSDGSLLWFERTPIYNCKGVSGNNLLSSPAVGELNGDGVPYVVIGYGGVGLKMCDGGVIAFRGSNGATAWNFSLKAFSKKEKFGTFSYTVFSSPALADTDGDGKMEIGFGAFDRNVYLLNSDGSVRWYYNAADTIWSSPAFVNVDNDPALEMIIGTDISANSRIKPITRNGGFVYAFKTAALKTKSKRIAFRQPGSFVWKTFFNQVMYSSPVIADVVPDTPGPEILIGSGCFFPQYSKNKGGKWIKVLRLKDGKVLRTLNTGACLSSSPAVGDIDDDGALEVVATVNGSTSIGGDGESRVKAWDIDNPEPKWSVVPRDRTNNDPFGGNFQSPVIADIDGNGSLEVLVANLSAVQVLNGRDGEPLTCQGGSCSETPYTLFAWDSLKSTPAVGDVDGDGLLDVVIGGGHSSRPGHGYLYGWTNFEGLINSPAGAQTPYSAPWPMHRGNAAHTAVQGQ